jgi:hypothetical protein
MGEMAFASYAGGRIDRFSQMCSAMFTLVNFVPVTLFVLLSVACSWENTVVFNNQSILKGYMGETCRHSFIVTALILRIEFYIHIKGINETSVYQL